MNGASDELVSLSQPDNAYDIPFDDATYIKKMQDA